MNYTNFTAPLILMFLYYTGCSKVPDILKVPDTNAIAETSILPDTAIKVNCDNATKIKLVVNDSLFNYFNVADFNQFGPSYNDESIYLNEWQLLPNYPKPLLTIDNILFFTQSITNGKYCNTRERYCLTNGIVKNDTLELIFIDMCDRDWNIPIAGSDGLKIVCVDLQTLGNLRSVLKLRSRNLFIYVRYEE